MKNIDILLLAILFLFSCENNAEKVESIPKIIEEQPVKEIIKKPNKTPLKKKSTEKTLLDVKLELGEFGIKLDTADLSFEHEVDPAKIPENMRIERLVIFGKLLSLDIKYLTIDSLRLQIEDKFQTIHAPYGSTSGYCNKKNNFDFFEYLLKIQDIDFDGIPELGINDSVGGGRHALFFYYFLNKEKNIYELNNEFTLPNLGVDPETKIYSSVYSSGGAEYFAPKYKLVNDTLQIIFYEKQWYDKKLRAKIKEVSDMESVTFDTIYQ